MERGMMEDLHIAQVANVLHLIEEHGSRLTQRARLKGEEGDSSDVVDVVAGFPQSFVPLCKDASRIIARLLSVVRRQAWIQLEVNAVCQNGVRV